MKICKNSETNSSIHRILQKTTNRKNFMLENPAKSHKIIIFTPPFLSLTHTTILTVIEENVNFVEFGLHPGGERPHRLHAANVQLLKVQLRPRHLAVLQILFDGFFRLDRIADTCCFSSFFCVFSVFSSWWGKKL